MSENTETTTVESTEIPDPKEERRLPTEDEITHSGGELQELRVVEES